MLQHRPALIVGAFLLSAAIAAHAADPPSKQPTQPPDDARQLVTMPAPAQQLLRQDMVDHLRVLNQLLAQLASAEFLQASELAEARLGMSSRGRHRGTGMGPGRFMPREMHQLGIEMHRAASDFATTAKEKDPASAYAALSRVTSFCVACHSSFRIR